MKFQKNISLKPYNSFGINVCADFFVEVSSYYEICEFLTIYKKEYINMPLLILGGGSNILFTKNYHGIVLKINTKGIEFIKEDNGFVYIKAYAGEIWETFVDYCVDKGWAGLENLSLIPGNVGSCPVQNIGAYGVEVKDTIYELEAISIDNGAIMTFKNRMCNFGYRDSIFKKELKGKYIIHAVVFKLNKKPNINSKYGAIEEELKLMAINNPDIRSISNAVCAIRQRKLPDPKILGNAGSFFKNPTVSSDFFHDLKSAHPEIVAFKLNDGNYKIAAGYLIEACGWRGKRTGECGVYDKQALILVNFGNASGQEIIDLAGKIKDSVFREFNVNLESEVNII